MNNHALATTPAVSVLMSCYNAARWVEEAIQSVLNQTFADFEFIIVDDGSTDDTLNILHRKAALDPRFVIIAKANTGLGDSLNAGIHRARGEWIARLDADDVWEPTRLARQIERARADASLVFIGTGLVIIDENGVRQATHRYPTEHAGLLRHLRQVRRFPPHSSALYRSEAVRLVGGYRTRIRRAQDWDLWLRLSTLGHLACIPEPLVRIRKHATQVSHEDSGRRQRVDSRLSLTSYWLRANGKPDPVSEDDAHFDAFRRWLETRLDDEHLHGAETLRAHLADVFRNAGNRWLGLFRILSASIKQPILVLRLVWRSFAGETIAQQMAREWSRRQAPSLDSSAHALK
jgi:glycosyltransferase involved in cell wall biosynthesis